MFAHCHLLSSRGPDHLRLDNLDVDPTTNTVTATCETDLDDQADDGYYAAQVTCVVRDPNGNIVASGARSDNGDYYGYVIVTQTFMGTPGTTYTATGTHSAGLTLPFDAPEEPPTGEQFDPFNFYRYTETPQTYSSGYSWFGPGPEQAVHRKALYLGNTYAQLTFPDPPDHLLVVSDSTTQQNVCQYGGNLLERDVSYQVYTANNGPFLRALSLLETVSPNLVNSCSGNSPTVAFACTPTPSGTGSFTDHLSASCARSSQVASGCGYTIPDQKWEWCNPLSTSTQLPISIGDIGTVTVTNTGVNMGGNTTQFPVGTTFPK